MFALVVCNNIKIRFLFHICNADFENSLATGVLTEVHSLQIGDICEMIYM